MSRRFKTSQKLCTFRIGSMQSSSSSPNRNEEFNGSEQSTEDYEYRFYGKLAPKLRDHRSSFSTDASADSFKHPQEVLRKPTKSRGPTSGASAQQRKRGRQSKDEQLAQEHDLPASAEEFAAMSHMEIQSYMRDPKLTHQQKSLIKKIRRRGSAVFSQVFDGKICNVSQKFNFENSNLKSFNFPYYRSQQGGCSQVPRTQKRPRQRLRPTGRLYDQRGGRGGAPLQL